jgi:hypothetical protein
VTGRGGSWGYEVPTCSTQIAVRLLALSAGRPLPPARFLVLICVRGSFDSRAIALLVGSYCKFSKIICLSHGLTIAKYTKSMGTSNLLEMNKKKYDAICGGRAIDEAVSRLLPTAAV